MTAGTSSRPGVQERIFLHLSDYVDHTDKVEVPFALSRWESQMRYPLLDLMFLGQYLG